MRELSFKRLNMNNNEFNDFFAACVGKWTAERTYHYLTVQEVERSHTSFEIKPLTIESKHQVLEDNHYDIPNNLDSLPGFNLKFYTISEKGEEVQQGLNFVFVTHSENGGYLEGDYLRDRAYEEARPIISAFRFDRKNKELLMTTNYTKTVSVDSIILVNPKLRIRKIINYKRPAEGENLEVLALVGFGVEQKVE